MNMFQDGDGNTSSMRVLMLAWGIGLLVLVGYLTVLKGTLPDIPVGLAAIAGGILFGKLVQNHQEKK